MIFSSGAARRCVAPPLAPTSAAYSHGARSIADIAGLLLKLRNLVGISFADLAAV
jgi:hypothetical protein